MMKLKKELSLILALVLVAQLCLPVGAVAAGTPDTNPGAGEIVCTHHVHDEKCGYTEGTPCTFDPATCEICNPKNTVDNIVPLAVGEVYAVYDGSSKKFYAATQAAPSTATETVITDKKTINHLYIKGESVLGSLMEKCTALTSVAMPYVKTIGAYAFFRCEALTSVEMPNATNIESCAFAVCTNLASVDMPSATSIGSSAFEGCIKLANVAMPNATNIEGGAFSGCTVLASAQLSNVKTIGESAFYNCKELTKVELLKATTIGNSAFSGCAKLASVDMSSATGIGNSAFYGCTALISATMPNVTSIGRSAFEDCKNLANPQLSKVGTIGNNAFYNCQALTSIDMPEAISIGSFAFKRCSSLNSAKMPKATTIGDSAFNSCAALASVTMTSATTIGNSAFSGCTALTTIELPAAITIGNSAFYGCTALTIKELSKATTIGDNAFSGCTALTSVAMANVGTIGVYAFFGCAKLANVDMSSATSIDSSAFYGCTALISATMPNVTSIGNSAFYGCTKLTSVVMTNVGTIGDNALYGCTALATIELPKATTIGVNAFYGCKALTGVELPKATAIGDKAFFECAKLARVAMPSATTIGIEAFIRCAALTSVAMPSATTIGVNAFFDCYPLTNLTLGATPPTVGAGAFANCATSRTLTIQGNTNFTDTVLAAYTAAAASDDNTTDNLWYGWTLPKSLDGTGVSTSEGKLTAAGSVAVNYGTDNIITFTARFAKVGENKLKTLAENQISFLKGGVVVESKAATLTDGVYSATFTVNTKGLTVGTYNYTATFDGNRSLVGGTATETVTVTINKADQAALNIDGVPNTVTYGDSTFTLSTTGGSGTGTAVTYAVTAGSGVVSVTSAGEVTVLNAGTATIKATKAGDTNYNDKTGTVEITVQGAKPTVTWGTTAQSTTYTGSPVLASVLTAPTVTLIKGETFQGTIQYAYKKVDSSTGYTNGLPTNAGKYEIKAYVAAEGNYTEAESTNTMTLTINKSTPSLAISTMNGKTYDGTTMTNPTAANMTITGAAYADVAFAYSKNDNMSSPLAAAPKDAGTYYVQANVVAGDNTNTASSNIVSFTIGAMPVTVTVTAQNKVYDGTTDAQVSYIVSGTVGGDSLTATGTGAVFSDKNAGTKTVTASGINISGGEGTIVGNYTLDNATAATTTANITQKPIAWDKSGTVNPKTYDGSTTADVANPPKLIGVVDLYTVTVKKGTVAFANANVGTHAITATGFGIEGTDAKNYIAPTGQPTFANGTINAKTVTSPAVTVSGIHTFTGSQIRPAAAQIEVKDDTTVIPATNYTVSYGENINVKTGGSVTVNLKGNYRGNGTGNFTIGKATSTSGVTPEPILMTANFEKSYSIPLPTGAGNAGTLTYTVGTQTGDNIFKTDGTPKINDTNKTLEFTSAVGTTTGQTASVVITIGSDNYKDFTVTLSFKITAKKSVTLSGLTAANSTYDGTGKAGYTGTLLVDNHSVTEDQIKTLIFAYKGINGTNYSSPNAPTNAGSYKLVISVNDMITGYTGHHVDIPFTIAPQTLNVTAGDYKVTKVWDGKTAAETPGGALSVSGILNNEPVTVTPTPRDYPGSDAGNYTVTVDLALSGIGSGNYVLASNTVEVPGSIAKAGSYTGTQAAAPTLAAADEISVRLQAITVEGETVEYTKNTTNAAPDIGWQTSTDFGGLTAATTYYFFARVQENTNHPAGTASDRTAITTKQAVHDPVAPKSITITNGAERTGTVTLADVFGANVPAGATFGTPVVKANANVMKSFTTNGSTLSYTSNINSANTSVTDVFTVPITSTGYEEITLTVSFSTSPKASAIITATLESKKYDGKAVVQPIPTATSGGADVKLGYTYDWQKDGVSIPGNLAPKDVGNYALVITVKDDDYAGSLNISFMIVKRNLTVTATNAAINAGVAAPVYTFTTSGLVSGETLDGVSVTCGYKKDGSAGSGNAGRYPITVSGGTVSGGNDNYAIDYVPGTLTVTLDTTALDAAIAAAKAAKSGVSTSDKDPGQVTNGTSFVTTAAMAALDSALAGAEASKAGATTNGQIAAAKEALTDATAAFNLAIRIGTCPIADDDWEPAPKPKPTPTPKPKPEPEPEKPSADKLTDIKSHWAEESIKFVVTEGLFKGISDTDFAPDMNTTRSMLVTVLYRQAGAPAVEAGGSAWYASAQAWAMQAGISDGSNMEREMTRQELVTMLHRFAKQLGVDVSVGEDTNILSYNDAFDLPQWSIPAFQWACGAGIVKGADENLLPNATATRAEVAAMLQRFLTMAAK